MSITPYPADPDWPANFQGCRIQAQYVDFLARPVVGRLILRPAPSVLLNAAAKKIIIGTSLEYDLDANGAVDFVIPASDDPDLNPSGWTYTLSEQFVGVQGRTYEIQAFQNQIVNLVNVAPVVGTSGNAIVRGPAGASAYQIAQANGYTGTEQQWLDSLYGSGSGGGVADWQTLLNKPAVIAAGATQAAARTAIGAVSQTDINTAVSPKANTTDVVTKADAPETVMDLVFGFLKAGSGVTLVHDDTGNALTINAASGGDGTGTGVDVESVRDAIGTTLVAGSAIQITVDDPGDTVTIRVVSGATGAALLAATTVTGARNTLNIPASKMPVMYFWNGTTWPDVDPNDVVPRWFFSGGYPNAPAPDTVPAIKAVLKLTDFWDIDEASTAA